MTSQAPTKTILLHGLNQTALIMRPLARRLQQAGFDTHCHRYYSLKDPINKHSKSLNNWLNKHHNPQDPIHLIGHSLGGLVIRDFLFRYPQWQVQRCVTLGTPHLGSVSADYAKRLLPLLVGRAYIGALDGKTPKLADGVCLGVIAGSKPHGLGQFFLQHHKKQHSSQHTKTLDTTINDDLTKQTHTLDSQFIHDGSVLLSETQLPNATDHIVLPVSHTGMLMDKTVAEQTIYFLQNGAFKPLSSE